MHNVVGGTPWIEHYGKMSIICHNKPELSTVIDFCKEKTKFFSEPKNEIRGLVCYKQIPQLKLCGSWHSEIHIIEIVNKTSMSPKCQVIITLEKEQKKPLMESQKLPYGFKSHSILLNDMVGDMASLAPTDSRWRPDQRLYEQGLVESADMEKKRLENLQRSKKEHSHTPLWFKQKTLHGSGDGWKFWAANAVKFWAYAEQRQFPQSSVSLW